MNTKRNNTKGYSVIEVMFAVTLFLMFAAVFVSAFIGSQQTTSLTGKRDRATDLANEGMEAVRSIRDANYKNLTPGDHGLSTTNNQWDLTDPPDNIGEFTRVITIEDIDTDRKRITSQVSWPEESDRKNSVSVTSILSNWRETPGDSDVLKLINAADQTAHATTTHTVDYHLASDTDVAGDPLTSLEVAYPNNSFDVSNINGTEDILKMGIDQDLDDVIEEDLSGDITDVVISDGGNTLEIVFGSYTLQGDEAIIAQYGEVVNPGGGSYDVDVTVNNDINDTGTLDIYEEGTCGYCCMEQGYDTGDCRGDSDYCPLYGQTHESGCDEYCGGGDACCCGDTGDYRSCDEYCADNGYNGGECRGYFACLFSGGSYEDEGTVYCNSGICCCN